MPEELELVVVGSQSLLKNQLKKTKFYGKGNQSAGTRARKAAQELKELMHTIRKEILNHGKTEKND